MSETVPETYHLLAAYDAMIDRDIIHDHTTLGPVLAARAPAVPVVATNHGPFTRETRAIYAAASERVSVVAISHSQAASARPDVDIQAVIHHGIDVDSIPVGDGSGGYVLFLGRMSPDKGADIAIEAARRAGIPIKIAAKCREARERQYFDACIRPLLGRDVEFLGEVGGDDKFRLLGDAAALLNPIQWAEPFGLVMAEALACGTPVIATPLGAAPEIIEHGTTGFLCDDIDQLVAALGHVDDISRASCRARAITHLSVDRMVAEHLALYDHLLSADPLGPTCLLAGASGGD
jgi:glycosyltransferase involved in cell wall biosynthesis